MIAPLNDTMSTYCKHFGDGLTSTMSDNSTAERDKVDHRSYRQHFRPRMFWSPKTPMLEIKFAQRFVPISAILISRACVAHRLWPKASSLRLRHTRGLTHSKASMPIVGGQHFLKITETGTCALSMRFTPSANDGLPALTFCSPALIIASRSSANSRKPNSVVARGPS